MVTSATLIDPKVYEPQTPVCLDCLWFADECPCGCGWGICARNGHWVEYCVDTCENGRER